MLDGSLIQCKITDASPTNGIEQNYFDKFPQWVKYQWHLDINFTTHAHCSNMGFFTCPEILETHSYGCFFSTGEQWDGWACLWTWPSFSHLWGWVTHLKVGLCTLPIYYFLQDRNFGPVLGDMRSHSSHILWLPTRTQHYGLLNWCKYIQGWLINKQGSLLGNYIKIDL